MWSVAEKLKLPSDFRPKSPSVICIKKFKPLRKAKKPAKLLALRCYDKKPKPSRKAYDIFLPGMPSPLIRRAAFLIVVELGCILII